MASCARCWASVCWRFSRAKCSDLSVNCVAPSKPMPKMAEAIKASGKTLTTIYISHGDPDYYFGLATLQDAFPQARIVATAQTVAHIQQTQAGKLAYWGPILKDSAPARTLVPEALQGDQLTLEGQRIEQWLLGHAAELAAWPLADLAKIRQDTKAYAPALRQFSQQLLTRWLSQL